MWNKFLDWIARAYYWVYCKFCQRRPDEPWTRQSSRFEERWPAIFWLFWLIVLGISTLHTVDKLGGWWCLLLIPLYLAASWWFAHILRYRVAHPENKPYMNPLDKAATWAAKRINFNEIVGRQ